MAFRSAKETLSISGARGEAGATNSLLTLVSLSELANSTLKGRILLGVNYTLIIKIEISVSWSLLSEARNQARRPLGRARSLSCSREGWNHHLFTAASPRRGYLRELGLVGKE